MSVIQKLLYAVFMCLIFTNCTKKTSINGTLDYAGNSHLIVEKPSIHYKYAQTEKDTLSISEDGSFATTLNIEEQSLIFIKIGDAQYPLVVNPGADLFVEISRSDFPFNTAVKGYPEDWQKKYDTYIQQIKVLDSQIGAEVEKLKIGQQNKVAALSKKKWELADKHLSGTPLDTYYLKAVGEYLVFLVRSVEYNARNFENFDADSARTEVFKKAKELNFFTYESLKAQRAGIRDFAHYYSRTFGIYDSVMAHHGKTLAEYDIKTIAYEELNEKRLHVLEHIEERDALAHAQMYLVAESIGEQSLEIATPEYERYLEEFADYSQNTQFLTSFYKEVKSVSPGEPAIDFSIQDIAGNIHKMEDYRGKFVLLDFWAGWCIPCLDEFPYMKEIYNHYSRDEFEILAISTEEDSMKWVSDIKRFENPWPQLYGGNGFDQETFKAYKGGGIPFYILVDPNGKIARYNDIRPSFNLTSVLDSLLKASNQPL